VRRFYERVFDDPHLAPFFRGHGADSRERLVRQTAEYFAVRTGGPERYTGRDMARAHRGLALGEAEWRATGRQLAAALMEANVAEAERAELLGLIEREKNLILER